MRPPHVSGRLRRALRGQLTSASLVLAVLVVATGALGPNQAAADVPTMGFYLAPPFVQTPTYVASVEDFDGLTAADPAPTPTTWTGVSTTDGVVGAWQIADGDQYGGATTDTPASAGDPQQVTDETTRSEYARVKSDQTLSVTLASPASCLGFWWSAGDDGNRVTLYTDGGTTLVASLTTAGIVEILNGGIGTVDARDGGTYDTADYYGHPVSNDQGSRATPAEPFAYVHAIAAGGFTFDRVVLQQGSGGNFELDNFAVALDCDVDGGFVTVEDDVLDASFAASLATPAAAPPSLTCTPDPVAAGGDVTCTVTGGDPDIDMLWRAALDDVFATDGVRLGTDGTGTFTFVVPPDAAASTYTVELVEWLRPLELGIVRAVAPATIPAGGGSPSPSSASALAALSLAVLIMVGLVRSSRRRNIA